MTTATKKLTRARANAELAKLLDPSLRWWPPDGNSGQRILARSQAEADAIDIGDSCYGAIPDFFTSRDDAAELVAWIICDLKRWQAFAEQFGVHASTDIKDSKHVWLTTGLLATPEQITLAACRALGIEVEDEANEKNR